MYVCNRRLEIMYPSVPHISACLIIFGKLVLLLLKKKTPNKTKQYHGIRSVLPSKSSISSLCRIRSMTESELGACTTTPRNSMVRRKRSLRVTPSTRRPMRGSRYIATNVIRLLHCLSCSSQQRTEQSKVVLCTRTRPRLGLTCVPFQKRPV